MKDERSFRAMEKTTIGKKISALRKEKGLTQEELAEKLGVSSQAVSKWENDISCPDIMLLPRISELFGVTTGESPDGDKVRINLPMALVKIGMEMGVSAPQISGNSSLVGIDFTKIVEMAEKGLIGKLMEVESSDGDNVEIAVEEI